MIENYSDRGCY